MIFIYFTTGNKHHKFASSTSWRFIPMTALLLLVAGLVNVTIAQPTKKAAKQVKQIMKEKNSRTAVQQKIDSRLLQAIREGRGEKSAAGLEPANVGADRSGNLTVDIDAKVSDSLLGYIKTLGGTVISSFKQYNAIRALIKLSQVEILAARQEVTFVKPAAVAQTNKIIKPAPGTDIPATDKP